MGLSRMDSEAFCMAYYMTTSLVIRCFGSAQLEILGFPRQV
jgi:hypothetical protein